MVQRGGLLDGVGREEAGKFFFKSNEALGLDKIQVPKATQQRALEVASYEEEAVCDVGGGGGKNSDPRSRGEARSSRGSKEKKARRTEKKENSGKKEKKLRRGNLRRDANGSSGAPSSLGVGEEDIQQQLSSASSRNLASEQYDCISEGASAAASVGNHETTNLPSSNAASADCQRMRRSKKAKKKNDRDEKRPRRSSGIFGGG